MAQWIKTSDNTLVDIEKFVSIYIIKGSGASCRIYGTLPVATFDSDGNARKEVRQVIFNNLTEEKANAIMTRLEEILKPQ